MTVETMEDGLANLNGTPLSQITVRYVNNGTEDIAYGTIDWKAEDTTSAKVSPIDYPDAVNPLVSGNLAPGETMEATLYFATTPVKIIFEPDILSSGPSSSWVV